MAGRTLSGITKNGTRLEMLERLAQMLAKRLDAGVDEKSLAGVAKQYRETVQEMDSIRGGSGKCENDVDELMQARAARGRSGAVRRRRDLETG